MHVFICMQYTYNNNNNNAYMYICTHTGGRLPGLAPAQTQVEGLLALDHVHARDAEVPCSLV